MNSRDIAFAFILCISINVLFESSFDIVSFLAHLFAYLGINYFMMRILFQIVSIEILADAHKRFLDGLTKVFEDERKYYEQTIDQNSSQDKDVDQFKEDSDSDTETAIVMDRDTIENNEETPKKQCKCGKWCYTPSPKRS
jgi:hypothetical protein